MSSTVTELKLYIALKIDKMSHAYYCCQGVMQNKHALMQELNFPNKTTIEDGDERHRDPLSNSYSFRKETKGKERK